MKRTMVMLCILGTSLAGTSQDKSFDLSKYKFPDYKRHELELNFNSSGQSSKGSQDEPSSTGDGTTVMNDYLYSYFSSNFSLGYQYDYLTRKQIDYLYSKFSGEYGYSKNNRNGNTSKQYNPRIDLYLTGFKRYYLKENKFFLEGMTDLNYIFDESKNTYSYMDDTKSSQKYLDVSVGFGAGTGRMEKVSDLWQTYYILEKLKAQKSLSRELEEKDIFEVAAFVSKLKNKRFFDSRLQKIAELQALDSTLRKRGLVEDSDISYFTTLNDYWSYGNFHDRESGRVFKVWLSPEYQMHNNQPNDTSSVNSDKTSLISNISLNCTKQLNLFWERHFNVLLSNESVIDTTGKYYNSYPANNFKTNVNFGYGFFPNSRTSISGNIGYSGQKMVVLNATTVTPNDWVNRAYINLIGAYYISPQLQITGNFNLDYIDKSYNSHNQVFTRYNLGLRYAIF